jgi:hypothetical protein
VNSDEQLRGASVDFVQHIRKEFRRKQRDGELSELDAAKKSGLCQSALNAFRRDDSRGMDGALLEKLANALGYKIELVPMVQKAKPKATKKGASKKPAKKTAKNGSRRSRRVASAVK